MTSTVLDVTVMLLCVSAAVVTLADPSGIGGTGGAGGTGADGTTIPNADRVADRLATETATIDVPTADGTDRTFHATLVELATEAAWTAGLDSEKSATLRDRVRSTLRETLGPRTRVDVRGVEPLESNDSAAAESTESAFIVGPDPPREADVRTAVVTHPAPRTAGAEVVGVRVVVWTW